MEAIRFDAEQLTSRDRKVYDAMNEHEQQVFQRIWIQIEEQKRKLKQLSNASKSRIRREFYSNSKRERKERAHRLIECGAMMEAYIDGLSSMNNDEVKEVVQTAASSDLVQAAVLGIQKRKEK